MSLMTYKVIKVTNDILKIKVAIIDYPNAMRTAVYGMEEVMILANEICATDHLPYSFQTQIISIDDDTERLSTSLKTDFNIVVIPPCIGGSYYRESDAFLSEWLATQHKAGALICSACAGAFILADTGLLQNRPATTHWGLVEEFNDLHPAVYLQSEKILVNDGDLITAGGLMSWLDLALELVAQFTSSNVMRQLGKRLVIDTAPREQRYYESFLPKRNHGDAAITKAQYFIQMNFRKHLQVKEMAAFCALGSRTFLRRFTKATHYKPNEYIQRFRIQKACDYLETSTATVESISHNVGYEDINGFRKTFTKIIGLTPKAFRGRFS